MKIRLFLLSAIAALLMFGGTSAHADKLCGEIHLQPVTNLPTVCFQMP